VQYNLETLNHPPFENDPPVKLNIPAMTLGLVYAIVATIALVVLGFLGLLGLLLGGFLTAGAVALGGGGSPVLFFLLSAVRLVIQCIGYGFVALGGYRMYQGDKEGRSRAELGIFILVVGGLFGVLATFNPFSIIFGLFFWAFSTAVIFCFYYLLVISRFPDEAPLVAGGVAPPPPPPPPAGTPPPPGAAV
jgi:hypothetical protein